jgi:hypothetical protein
VALSGDTALAGAPGCCASTTQPGTAFRGAADIFVHRNGRWVNQVRLTARDGVGGADNGDLFGSSVAPSGDTALVGAPAKNARTGAAYDYLRTGASWTQKPKLAAPDGTVNDNFGFAAAIARGTALVGAPLHNANRGAVYLFHPVTIAN